MFDITEKKERETELKERETEKKKWNLVVWLPELVRVLSRGELSIIDGLHILNVPAWIGRRVLRFVEYLSKIPH